MDDDWRGISKREWAERAEDAESRLSVAEIGLHNQVLRTQELEAENARLLAELEKIQQAAGTVLE